ncbi:Aste57867_1238 [Aphanomyces stellatus]|uniref:Aste57867_1238 protein n=1 Tax=Aphanomyces stellatus TaxID=120398 RepID=A0A485K7E2_9STRA|nr:hypothetical protein As57867_001237 [Aphanomyces stellatus]VFT78457.1 Aste57867_1238 [Aphanomyces stellatus]
MKQRGYESPDASHAVQIMAALDAAVAAKCQEGQQLSLTATLDDGVLWELIQSALSRVEAANPNELQAKDAMQNSKKCQDTFGDVTTLVGEYTRDAPMHQVISKNLVSDYDGSRSPKTTIPRLAPLESPRVATLTECTPQSGAPQRHQTMLEHIFGTKNTKGSPKHENEQDLANDESPSSPTKEARILVGGLTNDNIALIARYIHLLGYGQALSVSTADETIALCQPQIDASCAIDVVVFVVGRDLDQAVPMLEILQALVGPHVIVVGSDPDNEAKTQSVARQCVERGATYFATLPIVFADLRHNMQRSLKSKRTKFAVARTKGSSTYSSVVDRRSSETATSDKNGQRTRSSWFNPNGTLPSLVAMVSKMSSNRKVVSTEIGAAKSMSRHPPALGQHFPRTSSFRAGHIDGQSKSPPPPLRRSSTQSKSMSPRRPQAVHK